MPFNDYASYDGTGVYWKIVPCAYNQTHVFASNYQACDKCTMSPCWQRANVSQAGHARLATNILSREYKVVMRVAVVMDSTSPVSLRSRNRKVSQF